MEIKKKRTVAELGNYFNGEVNRFTDLANGQATIKDSRLMMDLFLDVAPVLVPNAVNILDIGCGAGNQTLNLLQVYPAANCTLLDISPAMLAKAKERVNSVAKGKITCLEGDIRTTELPEKSFDVAVAAAVLHHMRTDEDWNTAFSKIYSLLKPGGVMLILDLIKHDNPEVNNIFKKRGKKFMYETLGAEEAERILQAMRESDTPSSLEYQFNLLKKIGFRQIELLHKTILYGAYYALK